MCKIVDLASDNDLNQRACLMAFQVSIAKACCVGVLIRIIDSRVCLRKALPPCLAFLEELLDLSQVGGLLWVMLCYPAEETPLGFKQGRRCCMCAHVCGTGGC